MYKSKISICSVEFQTVLIRRKYCSSFCVREAGSNLMLYEGDFYWNMIKSTSSQMPKSFGICLCVGGSILMLWSRSSPVGQLQNSKLPDLALRVKRVKDNCWNIRWVFCGYSKCFSCGFDWVLVRDNNRKKNPISLLLNKYAIELSGIVLYFLIKFGSFVLKI